MLPSSEVGLSDLTSSARPDHAELNRRPLGIVHLPSHLTPQLSPFILGRTAPDAMLLATVKCPGQALLANQAGPAHLPSVLRLVVRSGAKTDREKQVRIFVQACTSLSPVQSGLLSAGLARKSTRYGQPARFGRSGCARRRPHQSLRRWPAGRFVAAGQYTRHSTRRISRLTSLCPPGCVKEPQGSNGQPLVTDLHVDCHRSAET